MWREWQGAWLTSKTRLAHLTVTKPQFAFEAVRYSPAVDVWKRELWMRLLEIPGIEEGANSWGDDTALWVNGKQMANFHRDGTLEIRLTRPVIRELKARLRDDPQVTLRGSSDWASFAVESEDDFEFIVEMVRRAAEAYLPADGTAPKPPPTGAAMERRKRFH